MNTNVTKLATAIHGRLTVETEEAERAAMVAWLKEKPAPDVT